MPRQTTKLDPTTLRCSYKLCGPGNFWPGGFSLSRSFNPQLELYTVLLDIWLFSPSFGCRHNHHSSSTA